MEESNYNVTSSYYITYREALMRYLVRKKRARVSHVWHSHANDTACRMYSTGGLNKKRYKRLDHNAGLPICENCTRNILLANQGKGHDKKMRQDSKNRDFVQRHKKAFGNSHTYQPDNPNQADLDADEFVRKHGGW